MKTVSEQLKKAIQGSKVSRYRIAQETGIHEAALSRFMSGERGLSMDAIDRLAKFFGYKLIKTKEK